MIISLEDRKSNPKFETLHARLSSVYNKMVDRVTNPKHKQYKDYGGQGVTIDTSWNSTASFINDVDKIPGWDTEKFLNHNLELDKDLRFKGNKLYSKDTCMWVTHKQNMQYQPLKQVPFYAYNEYTGEIKEGVNQMKFASEHGISSSTISSAVNGRKHRSGDWWFWPKKAIPPEPKRYYYRDVEKGTLVWDVNPRRLSIKVRKNTYYIGRVLKKGAPNNIEVWVEKVDLESLVKMYNKSSTTKFPDSY